MNAFGLVCAAAGGAAQVRLSDNFPALRTLIKNLPCQPLMSLLFGRLTENFVEFGTVIQQSNLGNATAQAELPGAAASFRRASALNASYLTYIGTWLFRFCHGSVSSLAR